MITSNYEWLLFTIGFIISLDLITQKTSENISIKLTGWTLMVLSVMNLIHHRQLIIFLSTIILILLCVLEKPKDEMITCWVFFALFVISLIQPNDHIKTLFGFIVICIGTWNAYDLETCHGLFFVCLTTFLTYKIIGKLSLQSWLTLMISLYYFLTLYC